MPCAGAMNADAAPCRIVIFGATGHLSRTKLLPALCQLEASGRLPQGLRFTAFARRDWTDEQWRGFLKDALTQHGGDARAALTARFDFFDGDYNDAGAFAALARVIATCSPLVFYLAIPPRDYAAVATHLAHAGLDQPRAANRIVVEKPFGHDLQSARELNALLQSSFDESQIYRIDHYLGKETVQNLFVFRFANTLIEPLWNRNYIDQVQISVSEQAGIGDRAGYYDDTGALADMLQNHLLQLLSITAMEPPAALDADSFRDEKVKVLRSLRPLEQDAVVRAQYAGYLDHAGVSRDSTTETFVAARLQIDNWRWRGVPFYLRTGKRLREHGAWIALRLREPPQQLFSRDGQRLAPNWIVLTLQPDESMRMEIHARQPGLDSGTRIRKLDADYRAAGESELSAYAALLLDVIEGDRRLFLRADEVEWAWRVVDPVMKAWREQRAAIAAYPADSWGPPQADALFENDADRWRNEF